jgi:glycolate oxidase FAD binding subunit
LIADSLREIVGSPHVRPASQADYVCGVQTQLVVEPADAQEAARVLRAADDHRLAVIPRGGGTKLGWGNPPERADIVLSMSRMNRVIEHPWADLTVTVEAGCTIGSLQSALREHGQRLAVDPLWPDRATVGGVLSANDTGPWRLRFGGLRDLVIGTTLALADGTIASSGGKVVKNVAGYDLSKLATGALGTLGVITTAIFRLHPIGRDGRSLTASLPSLPDAQSAIDAVLDSQLTCAAVQLRAPARAELWLDVLFEGSGPVIEDQIHQLQAICRRTFEIGRASVWSARETLWSGDDRSGVLKIAVLPSEIATSVEVARGICDENAAASSAVIQATGIGWLQVLPSAGKWPMIVGALRARLGATGGVVAILRAPAGSEQVDTWGDAGDAQALMRSVKTRFDPHRTLNPGRFVAGI